jgi:hypothetical protein
MWFILGGLIVAMLIIAWHVVLVVATNIQLTNRANTTQEFVKNLALLMQDRIELRH